MLISTAFQSKPDQSAKEIGFPQTSKAQKHIMDGSIVVVTMDGTNNAIEVEAWLSVFFIGSIIWNEMIVTGCIPDDIFSTLFLDGIDIHKGTSY